MASHDEFRADDARDPSGAPPYQEPPVEQHPAPPGEASDPEPGPGAIPPSRPRGVASFPGGPPPASTPTEPLATPPAAVRAAEPAPRFQVTTVETTAAASFPGGPPPARPHSGDPAPPPAEEPAAPPDALVPVNGDGRSASGRRRAGAGKRRAVTTGEPKATAADGDAVSAAVSTGTRPDAGNPGVAAPEAATAHDVRIVEEAAGDAALEAASQSPAPTATAGTETALTATATSAPEVETTPGRAAVGEQATLGRAAVGEETTPGSLGRSAPEGAEVEVASGGAGAAAAVAAERDADEEGGPLARPAGGRRRRRGRRSSRAGAGTGQAGDPDEVTGAVAPRHAAGPGPGEAAVAGSPDGPDQAVAAAVGEEPEEDDDSNEGSARTRARRRRRAAAKARSRSEPAVGEAPPADGGSGTGVADVLEATAAPAGRAGARTRAGQRGSAAVADAVPTAAKPDRPSRGRGRGRLAALAKDRAEAPAGSVADPPAPVPAGEPLASTAPAKPAAEGSTRLDSRGRAGQASRQADRGRRRRSSGLTEEQKRALREDGPERRMLVTEGAERTQIGVLEGRTLVEHYVTRKAGRSFVGNIYLGRVQNVLPGMEAAFVDIGKGRNAVLYAGEVNYNEEDLDGEAPRIERALKPGQSVLVQVTKDPIGAKGARLTAQVSLAGRYLVLQPEDNTFGISRRLPEDERSRLREILKEVRPKGLGLIVRTAAEGATADDLRADLARLQARWETVEGKAKKASAPAVIYSEPELVVRVIRDIFSPDFVEVVVDAPELYERVKEYLEEVAPDLLPKLRHHDDKLPLFEHHHVVEQIHKALERKVWLPSGGSIVIDRTEAMTVVDVNTGKFVGKSNLEETVVANNLEAAEEIVRQLRLRDIGGIIIIDFIDMLFERNQQAVVERLRAALARDKTKSQVMEVSSLGLVQMTRKRVSGGLLESFSETCPACEGRGVVITHEI